MLYMLYVSYMSLCRMTASGGCGMRRMRRTVPGAVSPQIAVDNARYAVKAKIKIQTNAEQ